MKEWVMKLINCAYRKFFAADMTPAMRDFVQNLSWVFIGAIVAKFLLFVIQVVGGRILGPEQYGVSNIIASISAFFSILMLFGLHYSITNFAARAKSAGEKRKYVSSAYISVAITTAASLILFFLCRKWIILAANITDKIFFYSLGFAVLLTVYTFSRFVLQGLHFMKKLSISDITQGAVTIIAFFLLINMIKSWRAIVGAYLLGYLVMGVLVFWFARKYISFSVKKQAVTKLFSYGFFAFFISSSGAILTDIDKIMVNHFLGYQSVGIYQAYVFSSTVFIIVLINIFLAVFFPTVSKYPKKRPILKRLDKFAPLAFIAIVLLLPFVTWIVLKLYGSKYPIDIWLIILFAVEAGFYLVRNLYLWLLNSANIKGIKTSVVGMLLAVVIIIVLNIILIPRLQLRGAAVSAIVSNIFFASYCRYKLRKIK